MMASLRTRDQNGLPEGESFLHRNERIISFACSMFIVTFVQSWSPIWLGKNNFFEKGERGKKKSVIFNIPLNPSSPQQHEAGG